MIGRIENSENGSAKEDAREEFADDRRLSDSLGKKAKRLRGYEYGDENEEEMKNRRRDDG